VLVLEGQEEALGGTFNAQDVANTLWAYATMARAPGAGLRRELEGQVEALAGNFQRAGRGNHAMCGL
jgi:hypothetical protein